MIVILLPKYYYWSFALRCCVMSLCMFNWGGNQDGDDELYLKKKNRFIAAHTSIQNKQNHSEESNPFETGSVTWCGSYLRLTNWSGSTE